jgi:hypothetical protein
MVGYALGQWHRQNIGRHIYKERFLAVNANLRAVTL